MLRSRNAIPIATLAAFALGCVTPLLAQAGPRRVRVPTPLLAIAINDLEFANVLSGIPKSVNVHEHRAALFEIRGMGGASVRIELTLPSALIASGGAVLPISFGAGDGYADVDRAPDPPTGVAFNPLAPLISTLSPTGQIFVRLGGTVLPGRPQVGGIYRATIMLTVYDLGS